MIRISCFFLGHDWSYTSYICRRCAMPEAAVYDGRLPLTLPERWRRFKIRWELSELRAVARLPVWSWFGGRPYRAIMRLAHRFNWHYMKPSHIEGDVLHWCQWCGIRAVTLGPEKLATALRIESTIKEVMGCHQPR